MLDKATSQSSRVAEANWRTNHSVVQHIWRMWFQSRNPLI